MDSPQGVQLHRATRLVTTLTTLVGILGFGLIGFTFFMETVGPEPYPEYRGFVSFKKPFTTTQAPSDRLGEIPSSPSPSPSRSRSRSVPRDVPKWRKIFTDFYLYSVYAAASDPAEIHAVVMAPVKANGVNFWNESSCTCTYLYTADSNRQRQNLTVQGVQEELPEAHSDMGYNFAAGRLRCPFFPSEFAEDSFVEFACRYRDLFGRVTVRTPDPIRQPPPPLTFAHCGFITGGIYNQNPASVLEFIEYHRLMGISRFLWNGQSVTGKTWQVLQYYIDAGVMEYSEWAPNVGSGKTYHNHGQVAAQYDCMLRTATQFDYTAMFDPDEYFATSLQPPTFASIVRNGTTDCAMVRSAFTDPAAVYGDVFESGSPLLRTARLTNRSSKVFPFHERAKYACRMRKVDVAEIHVTLTYRGTVKEVVSPPEETILLHLRSTDARGKFYAGFDKPMVQDGRAAALAGQLQPRVAEVWRKIFG